MARPRTGNIRRRKTKRGISYGLRFSWRGQRIFHHLGGSWEGWTEERVAAELAYIAAQVDRGEYVPPAAPPAQPASSADQQTFQVFASVTLERWRRRLAPKTAADLEWRLATAMDHFGNLTLAEITAETVDGFVDAALRDREAIEQAAASGHPLTETYVDPRTGRTHQRRRRSLSNSSINKVLVAVRRVLKEALRHGLIETNPLNDPDSYLRAARPKRSFLEVAQIEAVFAAARQVEADNRGLGWPEVRAIRKSTAPATHLAREYKVSDTLIRRIRRGEIWTDGPERRRNDVSRLALIATLTLAGVRISELCKLDGSHVDLPRRRITIPRVKTDASERVVPMVPALHELLLEHRAEHEWGPGDPVFATRNGTRNTPDNVRRHVVAPAHRRANALLADDDQEAIGQLTPHTLRRTFASLLAELGVSPRRAMYLLGHTDPKLTMGVYQQVLDLGSDALRGLEIALGCDVDEALAAFSGRRVLAPNWHPAESDAALGLGSEPGEEPQSQS